MLTALLSPSNKAAGHALVVAAQTVVADHGNVLAGLGYEVDRREDPYSAMLELCRRPLVFRAMVLSLQGLYRDELAIIAAVRRRFPHVSIYLTETDGRQAALAEAMRLGAEGLIDAGGLHSFADAPPPPAAPKPTQFRPVPSHPPEAAARPMPESTDRIPHTAHAAPPPVTEPVLSAEELRALLGDSL
jgi:hypothetical protein